jgi:hypothetical protein
MEKQFSFYDLEISKLLMSGKTYWSEKPDLTLHPTKGRRGWFTTEGGLGQGCFATLNVI